MSNEKNAKETKQVNFRIDPDSAEAFRQFCTSHGMNQAQGFDHLLQVLELNNAKAEVPGRIVEIENFERLLKDLLSAYINSIELSSNAEVRVQERFQSDLKRKDLTIDELREKTERIETEKKELEASMTALHEEETHLKEQAAHANSQMEAAQKAASNQEEMNRILKAQNQELQNKLSQYDVLKKSEEQARNDISILQLKNHELEQKLAHEMEQKEGLKQTVTQTQEEIRKLEDLKLEDRLQIADLKRQLADKDSEAQTLLKQTQMQADLEKERAVIAKEREMQEELRTADRENVRLQAELEQLRGKLMQEGSSEQ